MIYFDFYFYMLYFIAGLVVLLYKMTILYYPISIFTSELGVFLVFSLIYLIRLLLGDFGNKNENREYILFFIGATIFIVVGLVYFMRY